MSHTRPLTLILLGSLILSACDEAESDPTADPRPDHLDAEPARVDEPTVHAHEASRSPGNDALNPGDFLLALDAPNADSPLGWSFQVDELVLAEEADLVLSGSSCRGAVAILVRGVDAQICLADESGQQPDQATCAWSQRAGGNVGVDIDVGDVFFVLVDESEFHAVQLVDRTEFEDHDWTANEVGFQMSFAGVHR